MIKNLQELIPLDVASVYSGIDGRCCCGCSGTHRNASWAVAPGTEHRDVNDAQVTKTLRLVQAAGAEGKAEWVSSTCFSWVNPRGRVYIVYLREHGDRGFRKDATDDGAPVEVADWNPAPAGIV